MQTQLSNKQHLKAATLAVGTEVTDGQIVDRNSAWISQQLVQAGIQVLEHRAVPDDRAEIERGLQDLSERVEFVFVTGGLGPTSDDFTRELLAKVFQSPLELSEDSWAQVQAKLKSRKAPVFESHQQQCFFPKGARRLENPIGTAEGFAMRVSQVGEKRLAQELKVYALPGPPVEIAAIWEKSLHAEIHSFVPPEFREELVILRCLGKGESEIADITERVLSGSGLRIGYRASVPYVEVKVWYKCAEAGAAHVYLEKLEQALQTWVVNRNQEDLVDQLLDRCALGLPGFWIQDGASGGALQERIVNRAKDRKLLEAGLALRLETILGDGPSDSGSLQPGQAWLKLTADDQTQTWRLILKSGQNSQTELEVKPPYNYKLRSERARRYLTERALHFLSQELK